MKNFDLNQTAQCADLFEHELSNQQTLVPRPAEGNWELAIATRGVQGEVRTGCFINTGNKSKANNFVKRTNALLFPNRPPQENWKIELSSMELA